MAVAKENTATTTALANVTARQIDFVSQFSNEFSALMGILNVARPIKKESGAELKMVKVSVDLEKTVAEGETIPYSELDWDEVKADPVTLEKYSIGVTAEAINQYGFDTAVDKADQELVAQITGQITGGLYTTLADDTSALTATATGLQAQLAKAQSKVRTHFETIQKGITGMVAFVNTDDFYTYLGDASISVQTAFGMTYIQNFLGYDVIFLTSQVTSGSVIATALNNLNVYYIDPADSDFAKAGLQYITDETGFIGVHINGNYGTAVSETFAITGAKLFPEYADGIAIISTTSSDEGEVTP